MNIEKLIGICPVNFFYFEDEMLDLQSYRIDALNVLEKSILARQVKQAELLARLAVRLCECSEFSLFSLIAIQNIAKKSYAV